MPGAAKRARAESQATKDQVRRLYGISVRGRHEIDHLIPLAIGGSNELRNLWPQAYEPSPGALEKDRLELYLYHAVCKGRMTLPDAQACIRADWHTCWVRWGRP